MHHSMDRIAHTTVFGTPVVEHWQTRVIAQWVHHDGLIPRHIASQLSYVVPDVWVYSRGARGNYRHVIGYFQPIRDLIDIVLKQSVISQRLLQQLLPRTRSSPMGLSTRVDPRWKKGMFYLTTHSTHFNTIQIARQENPCHHYMGYSKSYFICIIPQTE